MPRVGRKEFPYTRKGKRDLKEHLDYIQRRADNPRFSDLKRDRTQNQLTDAMVEQGYSQVQDPKGNWHVVSPSGGLSHGGATGWGEHKDYSMAWRQKMSLNPACDPSATGDLTIASSKITAVPKLIEVPDTLPTIAVPLSLLPASL